MIKMKVGIQTRVQRTRRLRWTDAKVISHGWWEGDQVWEKIRNRHLGSSQLAGAP
jgi:hypothetical protein